MSLVVFLKGVNVGGHRRIRPSEIARGLGDLDAVSVGAAGTFIVRGTDRRALVRHALKRLLPFDAHVMICDGREIRDLAAGNPFAGRRARPGVIQFAGILLEGRVPSGAVPLVIPASGEWCVKVLDRRGRFVLGVHRRQMKAIRHLQQLEKVLGGTMTVRGWATIARVARLLKDSAESRRAARSRIRRVEGI